MTDTPETPSDDDLVKIAQGFWVKPWDPRQALRQVYNDGFTRGEQRGIERALAIVCCSRNNGGDLDEVIRILESLRAAPAGEPSAAPSPADSTSRRPSR